LGKVTGNMKSINWETFQSVTMSIACVILGIVVVLLGIVMVIVLIKL
jgi:hypothetical protein